VSQIFLYPPHRYTLDAELLVDSGANTKLKLLGLQPFGHTSRSRGSTNNICYNMNLNPVLVKATFARNGVEERDNFLAVKCDKNEYHALVAERAAQATLTGNKQGDQYSTPHQENNTPVVNLTNPDHITEIHLTPTRHRPSAVSQ
jgi:hypothetical protein